MIDRSPQVSVDTTTAILAAAVEEWESHVEEPPGQGWERIDHYIRSDEGLGWDWAKQYVKDRQFAWCGAFAAYCYGSAGLRLSIRKRVFPSTYRLYRWSSGNNRRIQSEDIQLGDVVVVGPKGARRWGNHITIAVRVGDDGIETIEGNAVGEGEGGVRYEGVVRQFRPFEPRRRTHGVMYGVRPTVADYIEVL
jgi:hypothetical protein